jgi:hypothetical protein
VRAGVEKRGWHPTSSRAGNPSIQEDTMTATPVSVPAPAAPSASFLARRPVWQVSYLAGLAASVVAEVWGLAARAIGVPMRAAGPGSHHATPVTVGIPALGTMVVTFWFTFAVIWMARFSKNPERTSLRTALPLLALRLPYRSPQRTRRPRPG